MDDESGVCQLVRSVVQQSVGRSDQDGSAGINVVARLFGSRDNNDGEA